MRKTIFFLFIILSAIVPAQAQSKTAHLNLEVLLDTLPSQKNAIAEINDLSRRAKEELQAMEANLEKEYNAYRQRMATQTAVINQYDEDRLQKMQTDRQSRETVISRNITAREAELDKKIIAKVKEAIAVVAERMGLEYVIAESSTLYARGPDITKQVVKELLLIDARSK